MWNCENLESVCGIAHGTKIRKKERKKRKVWDCV
jgi:hypothetical protein